MKVINDKLFRQTDNFNFFFFLSYKGELLVGTNLEEAVNDGVKNKEFTKLVEWICKELKFLCKLEETVNSIDSEDESSSFLLELSSFLKELGSI